MRNDVAYFLTLTVPKNSLVGESSVELEKAVQKITDTVEAEPLCFYSCQEDAGDDIKVYFDCDSVGGAVSGWDEDELLALLLPLSAAFPEVYFKLYCDDTDDKANKTYVFQNGQYRMDSSLLIDSALRLEPLESKPYIIHCNLDELGLDKVKLLLGWIGQDYTVTEMKNNGLLGKGTI